jgi:membrane associated rhomboid family serine protease
LIHDGQWWTLITALFTHGSLGHLLGNMVFLFLFGASLERIVGPGRLLLVFFTGGILSLLASHFYYQENIPIVGASGSICTILGLLMIYSPWKISFLLNFFPMPLGVAALTYMVLNYILAHSRNYGNSSSHTAYELHIAGFLVGIFFGVLWVKEWKKNLLISIISFIVFYLILALIIFHFRWRYYY